MSLGGRYQNRSVFITGHTGFKGAWLTEWLLLHGARVTGYSLPAPAEPALFSQLGLRERITHIEADIREADQLFRAILGAKPEFIFHLAAQSLVRVSYEQPKETYDVNVMGTVNVLEALRALSDPCAAVFITTDKCYAERVSPGSYQEGDPLGGSDPYSSSKAAAELAIAAYRRSYFARPPSRIALASARAGNVIGGGDWAVDRIVPDCMRALIKGESIPVRNRAATRPWQYILEPLRGYLELGVALAEKTRPAAIEKVEARPNEDVASAFNFGPEPEQIHSVCDLVKEILVDWPGSWHDDITTNAPPEAQHLCLAINKASRLLHWAPVYDFRQTVKNTVDWYRESASFKPGDCDSFVALTRRQIAEYQSQVNNAVRFNPNTVKEA